MMTVPAPAAFEATTAAMPRCPAPSTTTVSPRPTPPRWQAHRTPAPRPLYIAASSAGSEASILCSTEVGEMYMYSASPAGDDDLDGNPVASLDAPALGGPVTDLLDDAERFMARDEGRPRAAHVTAERL